MRTVAGREAAAVVGEGGAGTPKVEDTRCSVASSTRRSSGVLVLVEHVDELHAARGGEAVDDGGDEVLRCRGAGRDADHPGQVVGELVRAVDAQHPRAAHGDGHLVF